MTRPPVVVAITDDFAATFAAYLRGYLELVDEALPVMAVRDGLVDAAVRNNQVPEDELPW